MSIKESAAYEYCNWCIKRSNKKVPRYVKKQAKAWLKIADGKDKEAYVSEASYRVLMRTLGLIRHPDLGGTIPETWEGYEAFLLTAVFCTKMKADESRYYRTALLEICRKNFKTFVAALIFIIGMISEPKYSRFFSVAPDYKLSSELRLAARKILKASPDLCEYFKIKRDEIECKLNGIVYMPLAYSNDRMDGKLANIFLADECGAMDNYPIEAMRSSQITLKNKLGIIISTKYPNDKNALEEEVDYAKKVLDGIIEDKRYFALLYEPDEELRNGWMTDELCIYQSNPVAVCNKEIFKELLKKREAAILYPSRRENFLCKHNNIPYRHVGEEAFINAEDLKKCEAVYNEGFWEGKSVFVGLDLSMSEDNTAVSFCCMEDDILYYGGMCFIPTDSVEQKSKKEKLDYNARIAAGEVIACGDRIIDYGVVEEYILGLEEEYGFEIAQIGFDRYNAISTVNKLEREGYDCVEVGQHSKFLHSPTKLLKEKILKGQFRYEKNRMLEINFENAKCVEDTNRNKYINKKKSNGKIDMVAALLNAVYLLEQDQLYSEDFGIQC